MRLKWRTKKLRDVDKKFSVFHAQITKRSGIAVEMLVTVVMGSLSQRHRDDEEFDFFTRSLRLHEKRFPTGKLYVVDLVEGDDIDAIVSRTFEHVRNGAAIVFSCQQRAVWDVAVTALHRAGVCTLAGAHTPVAFRKITSICRTAPIFRVDVIYARASAIFPFRKRVRCR